MLVGLIRSGFILFHFFHFFFFTFEKVSVQIWLCNFEYLRVHSPTARIPLVRIVAEPVNVDFGLFLYARINAYKNDAWGAYIFTYALVLQVSLIN